MQRNVFWPKLYACGGTTPYCGLPLAGGEKSGDGHDLTIEHAYPADWIATHHGWQSCKVEAHDRAAADLHSLWPAIANINSSDQDQSLGEIPGEQQRRFQDYCPDYERAKGQEAIVEPRDAVKRRYGALHPVHRRRLQVVATAQPTARYAAAMARTASARRHGTLANFVIEGLQGNANPYIP